MMNRFTSFLKPTAYGRMPDAGLLLLRVVAGGLMMSNHGWVKLSRFSEWAGDFHDFLGLGGPVSMALAILAEVFCSIFLMLGLGTRLILLPLIFLAVYIPFVVNGEDPIREKELILMFLTAYLTLFLTGPGKFSLDYWILSKTKR